MGNKNSRTEEVESTIRAGMPSGGERQQNQQSQRSPQPGENQSRQQQPNQSERRRDQQQQGSGGRTDQQGELNEPVPYNEADLKEQDAKDPSGIAGNNGN